MLRRRLHKGLLILLVPMILTVMGLQVWSHNSWSVRRAVISSDPEFIPADVANKNNTAAMADGGDVTTPSASLPPTHCHLNYSLLIHRLKVNKTAPMSFQDISEQYPEVIHGGIWRPSHCTSGSRLAVVIPFRDRDEHLKIFLQHIHPFFQAQLIEYQIVVVEQAGSTTFNRGMMRNIGFVEANKMADFRCAVFQDVDLLPIDQRNLYSCPSVPRHLCMAIDKYHYKPLSNGHGFDFKMEKTRDGTYVASGGALFGGSVLFDSDHFRQVNGYSNLFFGWGGEDDDLMNRVFTKGLPLDRPGPGVGVYVALDHAKSEPNPSRWPLYNNGMTRIDIDGLSSLNYTVLSHDFYPTHTHIVVGINEAWYAEQVRKEIAAASKPVIIPRSRRPKSKREKRSL